MSEWEDGMDGKIVRSSPYGRQLADVAYVNALEASNTALKAALKEAFDHLEWIGYGDAWERECARDAGLEQRVKAALEEKRT